MDVGAALFVIGALVLLGGPALWWVFNRMDAPTGHDPTVDVPPRILSATDVEDLERMLGVALPGAYARFLQTRDRDIDATSLFDDPQLIIEATRDYRAGFSGLPPWPNDMICVGDEADACPYAIDCTTGVCLRVDKGNLSRPPLHHYENVEALMDALHQPSSNH